METDFRSGRLEQELEFVDELPPALFDAVVAVPHGELEARVRGLAAWRTALLRGELPRSVQWPESRFADSLLSTLEELGIARFCRDQPELVDEVLLRAVDSLTRSLDTHRRQVLARLRELEALEREQREKEHDVLRRLNRRERKRRLRAVERKAQAEAEIGRTPLAADPLFRASFEARVRMWSELCDVFGDLGALMGRGVDFAQSVLRHVGWLDAVALQKLVARLPQLREVVRSLGRIHDAVDREPESQVLFESVRRVEFERRRVDDPRVPAETRGIERSDEVARMLPGEAALLGHPRLRKLWHARRAERGLLAYQVAGTCEILERVESESQQSRTVTRPRRERGPVIAVIDTSGSMSGLPESVAKATVLELVRVAHDERRRCLVFLHGGPGEVEEREIDLSPEGIGRLLDFIAHRFGGGTDVAVIETVAKRLASEEWRQADVVIASDGEWRASAAVVNAAKQARARGVRFHGLQIGQRGATGLHSICDPVHVFADWTALR